MPISETTEDLLVPLKVMESGKVRAECTEVFLKAAFLKAAFLKAR